MKVKDLLEELKGLDPEAEVRFEMKDGCCDQTFDLDDPFIDTCMDIYKLNPETGKKGWMKAEGSEQSIRLCFPPLVYFRSCIKSGIMKKLYNERFDEQGYWRVDYLKKESKRIN